jgi:hypothetical protein
MGTRLARKRRKSFLEALGCPDRRSISASANRVSNRSAKNSCFLSSAKSVSSFELASAGLPSAAKARAATMEYFMQIGRFGLSQFGPAFASAGESQFAIQIFDSSHNGNFYHVHDYTTLAMDVSEQERTGTAARPVIRAKASPNGALYVSPGATPWVGIPRIKPNPWRAT